MRPLKLSYFILAAGIFILVFNALSGASIASKYSEINGLYKTNKVSARVLDTEGSRENSGFTRQDINHLQAFALKNADMAYAYEGKSRAAYESNETNANVFGISDKYNLFHEIRLKSGSFITPGNRDEMVAVVDETLAIDLFNATEVVGMYIELYDQRFRIIGVEAQDTSIVQTLTDNGYSSIYIPVEHALAYAENSKITSLEVRAEDMGTTGKNTGIMEAALASIGKSASDYRITDYNVEKLVVEEKAQTGIFISGIGIIAILLLWIRKRAMTLYAAVNSALKENYLAEALRRNYIVLSFIILEIAAALVCILLVWNIVKFNLYIPAEYIPDEFIDTAFYSDLFKRVMQERVQKAGYVPSFPEMKADVLNRMQGWILFTAILAGFPLYRLGLRLLEPRRINTTKHLLCCCIFIVLSILLSLFILFLFDMPVVVNTQDVLVVFVFIFLSAVMRDLGYG